MTQIYNRIWTLIHGRRLDDIFVQQINRQKSNAKINKWQFYEYKVEHLFQNVYQNGYYCLCDWICVTTIENEFWTRTSLGHVSLCVNKPPKLALINLCSFVYFIVTDNCFVIMFIIYQTVDGQSYRISPTVLYSCYWTVVIGQLTTFSLVASV